MKKIFFAVTNDLNSDQRMLRICSTLAEAGYAVQLHGRELAVSRPLLTRPFAQTRMRLFFNRGPWFYLEFNLRLFLYALGTPADIFNSVDLDTLPAMRLAAWLRNKPLVYDAHEIFTEVPELLQSPFKQRVWQQIERWCLPGIQHAYTVNHSLALWYAARYPIQMQVVRNMPFAQPQLKAGTTSPPFILYQGALNQGRGIEALLESMVLLPDLQLVIAGRGDLDAALRQKTAELGLNSRVRFTGQLDPEALQALTRQAWLGVNLLESHSLNYYYSLANKFFDYVQAGVPQLCMDFPEYSLLNSQHQVAVLCSELRAEKIAEQIQSLQQSPELHAQLAQNCNKAATEWVWENEKPVLLHVYARL